MKISSNSGRSLAIFREWMNGRGNKTGSILFSLSLAWLGGLLLQPSSARGETKRKRSDTELTYSTQEKAATPKFAGGVDLRPGVSTEDGSLSSENSAEVGMYFGKDVRLSYVQEINSTNIDGSQEMQIGDGSLRVWLTNLWERKDWQFKFSDQVRVYLPTSQGKRDAGMIAAIRNYFMWRKQLSESVAFDFTVVPILHLYNEAGSVTSKGPVANPSIEARASVGPVITLYPGLLLTLPVHVSTTKYRQYLASAENDDEWAPSLSLIPDLTYFMSSGAYVGTSYRTNNFVQTSDAGTAFADGVGAGVFQWYVGLWF